MLFFFRLSAPFEFFCLKFEKMLFLFDVDPLISFVESSKNFCDKSIEIFFIKFIISSLNNLRFNFLYELLKHGEMIAILVFWRFNSAGKPGNLKYKTSIIYGFLKNRQSGGKVCVIQTIKIILQF